MGRPSSYTQEIADAICQGLMEGRSLRSVCEADYLPTCTTVFRWLQSNDVFREQYARARDVQAEVWADELQDIADDGTNDFVEVAKKNGTQIVCDQENINRSRLRVDTRKWVISKILPKKYGDKLNIDAKVETSTMSDEELNDRILALIPQVLPDSKQS